VKYIVTFLIDLQGNTKMKAEALTWMSNDPIDKTMLIDAGVVSSLLPFIYCNVSACEILRLLCETDSVEYLNKIINTPNFLPSAASFLKRIVSRNYALREKFRWCISFVIESLGRCCCPYEDTTLCDVGERKKECVNHYALERCVQHEIPTLALRVVTETFPRLTGGSHFMACATAGLLCFFADKPFEPDVSVRNTLKTVTYFMVKGWSVGARDISIDIPVIVFLMRLCGQFLTEHLLSIGMLGLVLRNLERTFDLRDISFCLWLCRVLCCFAAFGSVSSGLGEKNAVASEFMEHGGMETIVRLERRLQDYMKSEEEKGIEEKK
jgi:hypothetical protein